MSMIVNAVNDTVNRVGKAGTKGLRLETQGLGGQASSMQTLANNVSSNLHHGAERCALVGQCTDFTDGIAQGDFKKATLNAALLSSYLLPAGGAASTTGFKSSLNSATAQNLASKVAGLSVLHSSL